MNTLFIDETIGTPQKFGVYHMQEFDKDGNPIYINGNALAYYVWPTNYSLDAAGKMTDWAKVEVLNKAMNANTRELRIKIGNFSNNPDLTYFDNLSVIVDKGSATEQKQVANVVSATDYYPFGMPMPGRIKNADEYRYGFNGEEKVDDITSISGGHLDYGARIYDPRVARWLSIDPEYYDYSYETPYNFAGLNPIYFEDSQGKSKKITIVINHEDGTKTIIKKVDHKYVETLDVGYVTVPNVPNEGTTNIHYSADFDVDIRVDINVKTNKDGVLEFNGSVSKTYIRRPNWLEKTLNVDWTGSGSNQVSGFKLVSDKGGVSPTKTKAQGGGVRQLDVDLLLAAMKPMGKSTILKRKEWSDVVESVVKFSVQVKNDIKDNKVAKGEITHIDRDGGTTNARKYYSSEDSISLREYLNKICGPGEFKVTKTKNTNKKD